MRRGTVGFRRADAFLILQQLMVLLVSERLGVVRACDNDEQFRIIYHSPEQHDRLRLERAHVRANVNFQRLTSLIA